MKKLGKKSLTNKLDNVFSEIIKLRDNYKCQKCGRVNGVQLQTAHIYSRRYRSVRWNPSNVLTLCAGCHFWAHQNPLDFAEWLDKKFHKRLKGLRHEKEKIFKCTVNSLTEKLLKLEGIKIKMEDATHAGEN